jgi:hypothetical protein
VGKLPFLAKRLENGLTCSTIFEYGIDSSTNQTYNNVRKRLQTHIKNGGRTPRRSVKGKSEYGT